MLQTRLLSTHRWHGAALGAVIAFFFLSAAHAWEETFGGCVFSDGAGDLLARSGTCSARIGTLSLAEKGISSLPEDVFDGMGGVTSLNLHGNSLTELTATVFAGLTAVERIYLGENKLSELPAAVFQGLSSLESLYLWGNKLQTLQAGTFASLTNLRTLYIYCSSSDPCGNGNISCIPMDADAFTALATYHGPPRCAGYADPVLCAAGEYNEWGTCQACPSGSSSPAGSNAAADCTCNSGFKGPAGGPCEKETVGASSTQSSLTASGTQTASKSDSAESVSEPTLLMGPETTVGVACAVSIVFAGVTAWIVRDLPPIQDKAGAKAARILYLLDLLDTCCDWAAWTGTNLEGDFSFSNDKDRVVSWSLCAISIFGTALFLVSTILMRYNTRCKQVIVMQLGFENFSQGILYIIVASSQASAESGNVHVSVLVGIAQAICFCGFQVFELKDLASPAGSATVQADTSDVGAAESGV